MPTKHYIKQYLKLEALSKEEAELKKKRDKIVKIIDNAFRPSLIRILNRITDFEASNTKVSFDDDGSITGRLWYYSVLNKEERQKELETEFKNQVEIELCIPRNYVRLIIYETQEEAANPTSRRQP